MSNKLSKQVGPWLYRLGFAVFIVALISNAYEAYTWGVQARYTIGLSEAESVITDAYAFLALAFILTFEMVGLILYKWAKESLESIA